MIDDQIVTIKETMAEMKGMLSVVISNHSSRLEAHDLRLDGISNQQNSTGSKVGEVLITLTNVDKEMVATKTLIDKNRTESKISHDEDIKELTADLTEIKLNQSGQVAKAFQIITPIVTVGIALIAFGDRLFT